ncbi:MAG: CopG family transcriptional regulator [Myxococcales bacterium]|nr:CopG family transcriptional regulator [Myxococcales bacterium]
MPTRINARLDDDLAARVEALRRKTGMTITEIVEAALEAWTEQVGRARPGPAHAFQAAGFIGSGRGPRHLARNAKAELTRSLGRKA